MTKILLVEDDKNLREIYGTRLYAEGYDIVSAGDGEEALAMAVRERPDLIISDVMMPKISGFDMLDILRTSEDTKNVPVIMMTALSSEDQRARGESLGATRYLVKSQVGIEDVVRTVHEVLQDAPGMKQPVDQQPSFSSSPSGLAIPERQQPVTQGPSLPTAAQPQYQQQQQQQPQQQYAAPAAPTQQPQAQQQPSPQWQQPGPAPQPPIPTTPVAQQVTPEEESLPRPIAPFSTQRPAGLGDRVIHPLEQTTNAQPDNLAARMADALSSNPAQQSPQVAQEAPRQIPVTQQTPPLGAQLQTPAPPVSPDALHIELPSVEHPEQPIQPQVPQQPPQDFQQPPAAN